MEMINMRQILVVAKIRWLRPTEICEILHNHHKFNITPDPPSMPPGGSLFLFDRKALRYFRKDGHRWRKKKDGKTVREAHEKLKSGNVDVLHCYYAHGEDNENFQRRCYWLLDGQLEHIVLVHYRDLSEEVSSSIPQSLSTGSTLQEPMSRTGVPVVTTPANNVSVPFSMQPDNICQPCADSSMNTNLSDMKEHNFSLQQLSCIDARRTGIIDSIEQKDERVKLELHDDYNATPDLYPQPLVVANAMDTQVEEENIVDGIHPMEKDGMNNNEPVQTCDKSHNNQLNLAPSSDSKELLEHQTEVSSVCKSLLQNCIYNSEFEAPSDANEHLEHQTDVPSVSKNLLSRDECNDELVSPSDSNERLEPKTIGPSALKRPRVAYDYEARDLEKLDSFGRWMDKELSKDSNESLIASSSCFFWNTIDMQNDDKIDSSLSRHSLSDVDSVTPSLSREQLFSIQDFSPDWAYSEVETKVLIVGKFLGGIQPGGINWCCMFGEIEVSAEVLTTNAIRCQAPPHSPGRVPFYITCSNRLACSEIRDFEYRENPPKNSLSVYIPPTKSEDEMHLKKRFSKVLFSESDKERLCSVENCENCKIKKKLIHLLIDDGVVLENTEIEIKNNQNQFCEKSLKQQLYEWLGCKRQEDDKGLNSLNDEGQGVIHLAATLGVEWAMTTLVVAGVNLCFRDARGRTALHWAAFYRRDEIIVALVKLGASSGAIEGPTSKFLGVQTAADLASRRGHKGIAGFLAEADLTDNQKLMSLSRKAAEAAANIVKGKNIYFGAETWQISLRESLATAKNSVQAAAQIRAAFRVQSFRQQQLGTNAETSEISCEVMPCSSLNLNLSRPGDFHEYLYKTAVKILQNFQGWKCRKEILQIQKKAMKIQARVWGLHIRIQYNMIVWSIGILEKVILRWRYQRCGFHAEKPTGGAYQDLDVADDYDFLRIGPKLKEARIAKALAIVSEAGGANFMQSGVNLQLKL